MNYTPTILELKQRILNTKEDAKILACQSAWDLFKISSFDCKDLEPSFAQASAALSLAKQELQSSLK